MPSLTIREFLIIEVRRFVESACRIRGVRRIALIGSLTTPKNNPKDADVLVYIDQNVNLKSLAFAGGQFKGRTQTRNCGADIFLADPQGQYLGRTCHWRDCRPGIRVVCRALHCGRRQYLYDDLVDLRLPPSVVELPALELWPAIIRRGSLPPDLDVLIDALSSNQADRRPKAKQ